MINKEMLNNFRQDLKESLKEIEKKYNLKIETAGITYTDTSFNLKLKAESLDKQDIAVNETKNNEYLALFGAKFKVGFEFLHSGKKYKVAGVDPAKRKNNIILLCLDDNKKYAGTINLVNLFVKE